MNTFLSALCIIALAAQPGDKVKTPPSARVLLVDHVSGFTNQGDKGIELRLPGPPKGNVLSDAVYVTVDPDAVPKDEAGKPKVLGREIVAVRGRLALDKVAVGRTGSKPAKIIYASCLRLTASQVAILTDKELKEYPAPGLAEVRGKLLAGKFAVAGDTAEWAIENGDLPIVLVGKAAEQAKGLSGNVVVTGRLRLVRPNIVLTLEVESVAAEAPPK
jgi:hypothetical protein